MSDRNIIRKEVDLNTYSVLTDRDKPIICDVFFSVRECLSNHDNPSFQSKTFVSLKPVDLKPFYMKPYLTHEKEIKFAETEMEKLRKIGILRQGSDAFLSPIMIHQKVSQWSKTWQSTRISTVCRFQILEFTFARYQL